MLTIFSSVLVLYATLASGSMIEKRSLIQTEAMCLSDFSWMDTRQQDSSPCLVAAQLGAICNDGHYDVPALNVNGSNKYDAPGAGVASSTPITFCTCSWAFYNLFSACTVCQNADFTAKLSAYSAFSILCSGRLSETYFPSNLTLPAGVTIPFYATTDPSTWTNGTFNVTAAKQIADTNHADVGAAQVSEVSHKKSSNIGAIVGGVVGGLVAVGIAAAIAFYILRRGRGSPSPILGHESSSSMKQHMRSESDVSGRYTTLSSTPMHYPSSPTILSHTTSVRSQPFQSSIAASTVPYGTASPPPQPIGSPPPARHTGTPPPATVEPYLLAPSNLGDRKKAGPGGFPEFDPVYAPPPNGVRMEISRPTTPERRAVARYNPPEYTERTTGASGSNSRPTMHRGKQESTDTLQSLTSSRNHGTRPTNVHHSPNSSGSGVPNISGQMTSSSNPSYNTTSTPSGHGRQISGSSRDEKRPRAESDSFNPKDLA